MKVCFDAKLIRIIEALYKWNEYYLPEIKNGSVLLNQLKNIKING